MLVLLEASCEHWSTESAQQRVRCAHPWPYLIVSQGGETLPTIEKPQKGLGWDGEKLTFPRPDFPCVVELNVLSNNAIFAPLDGEGHTIRSW